MKQILNNILDYVKSFFSINWRRDFEIAGGIIITSEILTAIFKTPMLLVFLRNAVIFVLSIFSLYMVVKGLCYLIYKIFNKLNNISIKGKTPAKKTIAKNAKQKKATKKINKRK